MNIDFFFEQTLSIQWFQSRWHNHQEMVYMDPHVKDILRSVPSTLKPLFQTTAFLPSERRESPEQEENSLQFSPVRGREHAPVQGNRCREIESSWIGVDSVEHSRTLVFVPKTGAV